MNKLSPVETSNKHNRPAPSRSEPDLDSCRAKVAGFGDYVDCQVLNPAACIHALSFAEGHLCLHPERNEIVARTKTGRIDTRT